MVNGSRRDAITRREFPLRRTPFNTLERLRRARGRSFYSRNIYVDFDEIPTEVTQAIDERREVPYELAFVPLIEPENSETLINSNAQPLPLEVITEEDEDEDNDDTRSISSDSSEASTIIIDLDNPTSQLPLSILRAWEGNAEIPHHRSVQTSPTPSLSSNYSPPSYSPVQLGDYPLNWSPESFSPIHEGSEDDEINRILDYLSSEEFLEEIDRLPNL